MENNYINYVEIPNFIIWDHEDSSLIRKLREFNSKQEEKENTLNLYFLIPLFYSLFDLTNHHKNKCRFTFEGLLTVASLKPNKDNIKDCKWLLSKLNELQLIKNVKIYGQKNKKGEKDKKVTILTCKPTDWIELELNYFKTNKNGEKTFFFKLYDYELEKIINYNKQKINNRELLTLFCYYVSKIYHREIKIDDKGNKVKKSLGVDRSEVCYPAYINILKDTGISENVVKKYNDILVDLDLILYKNAGNRRIKVDEQNIITVASSNTVALCRDGKEVAEAEVNASIEVFIVNQKDIGVKFVGKEKTDKELNKKTISNTITRLQALKDKNGKLPVEQEKKLNKFIQLKHELEIEPSSESVKWHNKRLLDLNEGKLLSQIYFEMDRWKEEEKYKALEESLGLIDEDEELLVDWNEYVWAMVNYTEAEHDYYFNSIKKNKAKKNNKVIHLGQDKPEWEQCPWGESEPKSMYLEDLDEDMRRDLYQDFDENIENEI